jgi:uncharacterized membrane protein (DUF4010 family)
MEQFAQIPQVLTDFLITLVLSFIIGLEQKRRRDAEKQNDEADAPSFGADRTFTFIGILGFMLYLLAPQNLMLFIAGAIVLTVLLSIFYYTKIRDFKSYGITSIIVALITYSLGPLVISQPMWVTVVIVVAVLILVEQKDFIKGLSDKININEFTTLAKFLVIAAVILPITPREPLIPVLNLTPYEIWLTVVVVSAISYASYLLQTYFFRKSGPIITGLLGGTYSSTATTMIISKRSKELGTGSGIYAASIILANAMMYLRVMVLMFIFNNAIAMLMLPYMAALIAVTLGLSAVIYFTKKPQEKDLVQSKSANPLELKVALLFAGLFILFSAVTNYTISHFGVPGLDVLSFVTGFTDIDPFLLNLFQGKFEIPLETIGRASFQAIISNNILKSFYILSFAESHTKKTAGIAMGIITVLTFVFAMIVG